MLGFYLMAVETATEKTKFEELYYRYRKQMKYIATGILKDDMLAEEAVHETFLMLAERIGKIGDVDDEQTRAMIIVMTKNISINLYKKEKRRSGVSIEEAYSLSSNQDTFEDAYVSILVKKIKRLPEIYRDTLEMRVYHDMSNKEIAKITGTNETTVRKRLQRARELLNK